MSFDMTIVRAGMPSPFEKIPGGWARSFAPPEAIAMQNQQLPDIITGMQGDAADPIKNSHVGTLVLDALVYIRRGSSVDKIEDSKLRNEVLTNHVLASADHRRQALGALGFEDDLITSIIDENYSPAVRAALDGERRTSTDQFTLLEEATKHRLDVDTVAAQLSTKPPVASKNEEGYYAWTIPPVDEQGQPIGEPIRVEKYIRTLVSVWDGKGMTTIPVWYARDLAQHPSDLTPEGKEPPATPFRLPIGRDGQAVSHNFLAEAAQVVFDQQKRITK